MNDLGFISAAVLAPTSAAAAMAWWQMPGLYGGAVALGSGLLTSLAIWLVWRKFAPMQRVALDAALKAQEQLTSTQSRHIDELKKERDDYRTKLHDCRDQGQGFALRIKELESQPNLLSITALLENQAAVSQQIVKSFQDHAASDLAIFDRFQKLLEQMSNSFEAHHNEMLLRLPRRRAAKL